MRQIMTTAKIVYASMTGNNEEIANILDEELTDRGVTTSLSDISFTPASEYLNYDLTLMVVYTYGEGEMPDEVADFYDDLAELDLTGKVYAVMGSGDLFYEEHYCETVDYFEQLFTKIGATKGAEPLKINLEADEADMDNIAAVADSVLAKLNEKA
ncbi:flavodoxin [Amylolactobacillus amylotrophicus DSM 20534]|nr:flavodoxin [Amylolactobacillus amylotrophicus DSM 20534]